jgi:hypothetical protein
MYKALGSIPSIEKIQVRKLEKRVKPKIFPTHKCLCTQPLLSPFNHSFILSLIISSLTFFFVALGFELKALCLLGRHSTLEPLLQSFSANS